MHHADDQRWRLTAAEPPPREGNYLVFAKSADPKIPFKHCAWWDATAKRWRLVCEHWVNAITHWMPMPADPE